MSISAVYLWLAEELKARDTRHRRSTALLEAMLNAVRSSAEKEKKPQTANLQIHSNSYVTLIEVIRF